jgi:hypothetical protein
MIRTMSDVPFVPPKDLAKERSNTDEAIWKAEVDVFVKRKEAYRENKCALYSIVWSQCSDAMQAKIKSTNRFSEMHDDNDSLSLLKVIKGVSYKFESQKNIYLALDNAKTAFYSSRQGSDETNANFMTRFKDSIEVNEHYGGCIGDDHALFEEELKLLVQDPTKATKPQVAACKERARHGVPATHRQR